MAFRVLRTGAFAGPAPVPPVVASGPVGALPTGLVRKRLCGAVPPHGGVTRPDRALDDKDRHTHHTPGRGGSP
ncbi:hypothetical protein GCM10010275_43370 [Streptomyces litmocidini]|nr:hypothetical protein GCM10010275_43370 [Streptomyces litmocidini]